jgi:nicotinamidase-related amidase
MIEKVQLPVPPHFEPANAGDVWRVPYQERAHEAVQWAQTHKLRPSVEDKVRICLVAVDCQNTFCLPGFELFLAGRSGAGAVEDTVRLCEFIYRNMRRITEIDVTMDTHRAFQIFHPVFWVNEHGDSPEPMTVITLEDVQRGVWRVNPEVEANVGKDIEEIQQYALHYVEELSDREKYALTIWPYHAMLGGIGHALVSSLEEAIFFHSLARKYQARFEVKGLLALTEHYSVLRPEVLTDEQGNPIAQKNFDLIEELLSFDAVVIAGQAKSHCVAWTIDNLLEEVEKRDARLAKKIYLLEDCTSPVVVPGVVDFTEQADAEFRRFADAGMNLVKSTDPMETWPAIPG